VSLRRDAARRRNIGILAPLVAAVVFILPFVFILFMAVKTKQEAARFLFTWPSEWHLWQNLVDVVQTRNYMLLLAYFNSTVITVGAVTLLVIFGAMVGYVLQRRPSGWNRVIYACILIGLMVPPAIVPTIWVCCRVWACSRRSTG
jgi:raffinose/stachyose/melibiose transport system permease protein